MIVALSTPSRRSSPSGQAQETDMPVVHFDEERREFSVTDQENILEFMGFTPHPMTPRMVWKARKRFGRGLLWAMYHAWRCDERQPWTENLTKHEEQQVYDYLCRKWGVE
jgi:hypothetical protein